MPTDNYHQRKAQGSDAGSSVAYIFDSALVGDARNIIRIKLLAIGEADHSVPPARQPGRPYPPRLYCEGIYNDASYYKKYNKGSPTNGIPDMKAEKTIVFGRWYRERLGCNVLNKKGELREVRLEITEVPTAWFHPTRWCAALWLSLRHPVSTNRLATYLGIIGVVLGFIGLVFGLLGIALGIVALPKH
jgi:hypothetical protein